MGNLRGAINALLGTANSAGNAYVSNIKDQLEQALQKLQADKMSQELEMTRDMHKMKVQEHDMLLKRLKRNEIPLNERFGLIPEEATVGTPEAAGGEPQSEYIPPPVTPDQTRRVQMPIDPDTILNKIFAPGSTATAEDLQAIQPALGLMEKREEFKIKRKEAETNRLDKLYMFQENISQKEADRASREQIAADQRLTQKMIAGMRLDAFQYADRQIILNTAKELPKLKADAALQGNQVQLIDKALALTSNGVTGKAGELKSWMAPWAEAMGIKDKKLSDAQLFTALTRVIVGPMRLDIVGPGPVTEYEQDLIKQVSGAGATLEAARELLNAWRSRAIAKVENYNNTVKGVMQVPGAARFGEVYPQIQIFAPGGMYNGKRIKGVDPDTRRLYLEDGSKVNY